MKPLILFFSILLCLQGNAQKNYTHTTSAANLTSNYTLLDVPGLNNNPQAIVLVFPIGDTRTKNPHPVGVWYTGTRWSVFNENKQAMPAGLQFTIQYYENPGSNEFIHKAAAGNNKSDGSYIDHPLLNNNPAADVQVTQNWNPGGQGGVYNTSEISIQYNPGLGRWYVFNTNRSVLPEGAAVNIVLYSKTAGNQPVNTNPAIIKPVNGTLDKVPANLPPVTAGNPTIIKPVNGALDKIPANIPVVTNAALNLNFDFESGLTNWTATGTAFSNQPIKGNTVTTDRVLTRMQYAGGGVGGDYWKGLIYPIGIKGSAWIGTYENGNGDAPTGTLTSKAFNITNRYFHFLLGGGKDFNKLYVELQVKKTDYEAAWGAGKKGLLGDTEDGYTRVNRISPLLNSEELYRYFFDMDAELNHQFMGKSIRIRIVDDKNSGWGHINVDDFGWADDLTGFIALSKDGFGVYADADKPVWGYFDSHAHPAADEAFGKNYYVGKSTTPLSTTWSNDVCTRSHTWGRTLDGFTNIFDPHKFFDGGWPDMWGFPKFNGKMHQKYQADLIKRAWQGGLKIFVALGINNMYIATRALGHNPNGEPLDDESVLLRQVQVMKDMAAANKDWMEIALTPKDARRIILEGKLCVILGLEADVFGNFKSPDCNWGDRSGDRPLVPITTADADGKLEEKLNHYYSIGLRQILPLHYLSKPFGGTAVFNGNTFLPQIEFYSNVRVKSGVNDRIGFSLYEDFPTGPALIGNALSFADYAGRIQKQDAGAEISMVNADGLTPVGNILFKKLMMKGFIIDQEHASYQSKRDMFSISSANGNYPIMASHCGPEGLSFVWTGVPVRFNGGNDQKIRNFNTSTIRFVSHEMELNDESFTGIRNTGGIVGVFVTSNHKRKYNGAWGNFENDCPGSTKTVAQMYCYSLDKMNGVGVGFASDLPMIDAVCPRFGPYSAFALTTEEDDQLKKTVRTQNRYEQKNGVRYDVISKSYHHEFFQGGGVEGTEEDAWKALAAWEAGANPWVNESSVSESAYVGHGGRVRNFAKGLFATSQDQLMRPGAFTGDGPWEQAAMFCLKNNIQPSALTIYDEGGKREAANMYNAVVAIWKLWQEKNGKNEPVRRYITGNRYWDFNLDGFAHYGMLPDLLQDLKNIGFNSKQFVPLFRSAEDYIKMWESADRIKTTIR
jgi:microsomal dipeptidase-like Zn-dependent dipeptidase